MIGYRAAEYAFMAEKNSSLSKFGENVRRRREVMALSQDQLADQADIHRTFISGIERGVRNPGLLSILRIAEALKTEVGTLFQGVKA
jgi:transcriptional regulator with XRE-family HTH domain